MASNKTLTEAGAISFKNYILECVVSHVSDEDPRFPADNLLSPSPNDTYRTRWKMDTNTGFFRLGFYHRDGFAPTVLSIIRSNITATDANWVRLTGSDNSDFSSTNVKFSTFPYYEAHNNIWIYYIDTDNPTSGTYDSYKYWAMDFYPNDDGLVASENYYEFGNLWLGTYEAMGISYGSDVELNDTSPRSKTKAGLIMSDSVNPYYEGRIRMDDRSASERQPIIDGFRTYGNSGRIIIDIDANNPTDGIRGHGHYYCKLDDKISNKQLWDGYSSVDIAFAEVPTK